MLHGYDDQGSKFDAAGNMVSSFDVTIGYDAVTRFFQKQGYHLLLFFAPSDRGFDSVIEEIIRSQVEGVLMLAITLDTDQAETVADFGIPVVIVNRTVNYAGISQVGCDNHRGGFWAGSYLASLGHRRIAYLAGLEDCEGDLGRVHRHEVRRVVEPHVPRDHAVRPRVHAGDPVGAVGPEGEDNLGAHAPQMSRNGGNRLTWIDAVELLVVVVEE